MLESTGVSLETGHKHSPTDLRLSSTCQFPLIWDFSHSISFSLSPLYIKPVLEPMMTGDHEPAVQSYCRAPILNPRKTAPPEGQREIPSLILCSSSPTDECKLSCGEDADHTSGIAAPAHCWASPAPGFPETGLPLMKTEMSSPWAWWPRNCCPSSFPCCVPTARLQGMKGVLVYFWCLGWKQHHPFTQQERGSPQI